MEKIEVTKFFESINYNWKNDFDVIKEIALITKTRVDENNDSLMPMELSKRF